MDQMNAKGGILGRQVELLVEESANDVGTGVQKARKLIERDQVNFMIGDVNSGVAAAIAQLPAKRKSCTSIRRPRQFDHRQGLQVECVSRLQHDADGKSGKLSIECALTKYGKKWHFITPDYAFGHTLYTACTDDLKKLGGTVTGNELTPLGAIRFLSAFLIKARAANPDVMILLVQGSDMINCLKQVVQFGLNGPDPCGGNTAGAGIAGRAAAGSARRRLDVRIVWKQPGVPGVGKLVADLEEAQRRQRADARHWFGYATAMSFALVANRKKTSTRSSLRRHWKISNCRTTSSCSRTNATIARATTELMTSAFVGEAQSKGKDDPEDLYRVDEVVQRRQDPRPRLMRRAAKFSGPPRVKSVIS